MVEGPADRRLRHPRLRHRALIRRIRRRPECDQTSQRGDRTHLPDKAARPSAPVPGRADAHTFLKRVCMCAPTGLSALAPSR